MLRLAVAVLLAAAAPTVAQFGPRPDDAKPADPPEKLPPAPKADPKSEHTPLTKDNALYIEKRPDGTKRVLVAAEVCLREGVLEVFLCRKGTKEHEAIVRVDTKAEFIHAALIACGTKAGNPVQFIDPKTGDPKYKAATGPKVAVSVHYTLKGKEQTHAAQEWIQDIQTKKPMGHGWVFAGSRFVKNPDRPADPDYYCANNGEVIGISNFPDSMLDIPVEISQDNASLGYQAMTAKIPPRGSKVWVILEPEVGKKK